ncbi:MAG: hypothetical protein QM739_07435 [Propionivibrio sp.]
MKYAEAGSRSVVEMNVGEIDAYRFRREKSLSSQDVCSVLGITKRRFFELRSAGLLPVLEGRAYTGHWSWRLDGDGFDALCENLRAKAPLMDSPPDGCLELGAQLRTRISKGELALTVQAITAGDLRVVGRTPKPGLLASLVVNRTDLGTLLEQHRQAKTQSLSMAHAARELGISASRIYHYVAKGHLKTLDQSRPVKCRLRVSYAELEAFRGKFIWLKELAQKVGTSCRRLKRLLDESNIAPISGPNIDGCPNFLLLRTFVDDFICSSINTICRSS